jgi:hypothetical protein
MHTKIILFGICFALMFFPVVIPLDSYAIDSPGGDIAALDTHSFIVSKEFAGEIKLYLCSVQDGRIFIKDSTSIPYMTLEHRELDNAAGDEETPNKEESPIIKISP